MGLKGPYVKGQGPVRSCCDRRAEAGLCLPNLGTQ